jgi:hypothetical protein
MWVKRILGFGKQLKIVGGDTFRNVLWTFNRVVLTLEMFRMYFRLQTCTLLFVSRTQNKSEALAIDAQIDINAKLSPLPLTISKKIDRQKLATQLNDVN